MDIILPLIASIITQILKRFKIMEKWGDLGVYVLLGIVSLIVSAYQYGWEWLPETYRIIGSEVFAGALVWYELILKRIAPFKKLGGTE
jgi:hypothetical protein